jgi:hypothetical protein
MGRLQLRQHFMTRFTAHGGGFAWELEFSKRSRLMFYEIRIAPGRGVPPRRTFA